MSVHHQPLKKCVGRRPMILLLHCESICERNDCEVFWLTYQNNTCNTCTQILFYLCIT